MLGDEAEVDSIWGLHARVRAARAARPTRERVPLVQRRPRDPREEELGVRLILEVEGCLATALSDGQGHDLCWVELNYLTI